MAKYKPQVWRMNILEQKSSKISKTWSLHLWSHRGDLNS